MNQRVYSGWRGVTDPSHQLLCVSYDPVEALLACRFQSRNEPYVFGPVPENLYQILIRSPYAGSYFRKHIKGKYPQIGENLPAPFEGNPPEKILPKPVEVPQGIPEPQMSLFAGSRGSHRKRASKG